MIGFVHPVSKEYLEFVNLPNGVFWKDIEKYISGSFVAVCGQSAVGKSSFINALIPGFELETQGLSNKIDRGKHTTRVNEIYLHKDYMIADTTGFSSLELDLDNRELSLFYPEFDEYIGKCKYLDCSHIKEGKDCVINKAVQNKAINQARYDRYCYLYGKLKEQWERKYD